MCACVRACFVCVPYQHRASECSGIVVLRTQFHDFVVAAFFRDKSNFHAHLRLCCTKPETPHMTLKSSAKETLKKTKFTHSYDTFVHHSCSVRARILMQPKKNNTSAHIKSGAMELPYKNKIYISVSQRITHEMRGLKTHHIIPVDDENALAVFCVVSFGIFHVELAGPPFTSHTFAATRSAHMRALCCVQTCNCIILNPTLSIPKPKLTNTIHTPL